MFNITKITRKLKNQKCNGNISLLVILVLLASSVIALLSINQIQRLISYWNSTFNYFRSYYLWKAWVEFALAEIYNRWNWFEDSVSKDDPIITENLVWEYENFEPYFEMNITWNFKRLTDDVRYTNECKEYNAITLLTWEWIVLPLFKDVTKGRKNIFNDEEWKTNNVLKLLELEYIWGKPSGDDIILWFFSYKKDGDLDLNAKTGNDLKDFMDHQLTQKLPSDNKYYISIKNASSTDTIRFCIKSTNDAEIPYSDSLVTVRSHYWDTEIWLQSVVKRRTPWWALNVLGDANL